MFTFLTDLYARVTQQTIGGGGDIMGMNNGNFRVEILPFFEGGIMK